MLVSTNKLVVESGYHNLDPLVWLLGCANETMVVVEGVEMMVLVDTGSQIFAVTEVEDPSTEEFDKGCDVS